MLHVAAWVCAVVFDIMLFTKIDSDKAPGAFTYWFWGFIPLCTGLAVLLGTTIVHALSGQDSKIPEGGAWPFLMTMFIGGAQISLTLTILQMIATLDNDNSDFLYINAALTDTEKADKIATMRELLVWTMLSKVYIVQFLKNNQEWAGPANELKKQVQTIGASVEGPRNEDGAFALARM